MNGKGSKSRPFSVPYETYASNFDAIFKKTDTKPVQDTPKKVKNSNTSK